MRYFSEEGDPRLYNCPCGNCVTKANPRLPEVLDRIRGQSGVPMAVTSGPRCVHYNIKVGGADYSEHIDGEGADISCTSSRARFLIIEAAISQGINRIGIGKTFIHLGISETNDQMVMWTY